MKNSVYEVAMGMVASLNAEIMKMVQIDFDRQDELKNMKEALDAALRENDRLSRLVEAYKSKSDLIIELTTPIDMHTEENKGLKLIK